MPRELGHDDVAVPTERDTHQGQGQGQGRGQEAGLARFVAPGADVTSTLSVELRSHPGCALVEQTRAVLRACLDQTGVTTTITEQIGAYPSPTVLIEGVDVMGDPGLEPGTTACRLDLPTRTKLTAALLEASRGL